MAWGIRILVKLEICAFWLCGHNIETLPEFGEEFGGVFGGDGDADVEAHAVEGLGLFGHIG